MSSEKVNINMYIKSEMCTPTLICKVSTFARQANNRVAALGLEGKKNMNDGNHKA